MTLIERLEKAGGGSQTLDAEICIAFQYGGLNSEGGQNIRTDDDWEGDLLYEIGTEECCCPIPPVTTSLDAALALAERVLPGCHFALYTSKGAGKTQVIGPFTHDRSEASTAPTLPLALCLAILRATNLEQPDV